MAYSMVRPRNFVWSVLVIIVPISPKSLWTLIFAVKFIWFVLWDAYHTLSYTLAAPGSVQKAAVMKNRARRNEEKSSRAGCRKRRRWKTGADRREEESRPLQWREVPAAGMLRWSRSRDAFTCLQTIDGVLCTVFWVPKAPLFIPVAVARLRPPGRAVVATLHVHWLGGRSA
jgi:hypothetical protein